MKTPVPALCALAAAGALALTGASASAQPQPSQGQAPDLHALLHIRPEQEGAWRAFQAGRAPPTALIGELRANTARMAAVSLPQRLDLTAQNMQLQLNQFRRSADVLRRFYANLTPDQQRIFDQLTLPRGVAGPSPR